MTCSCRQCDYCCLIQDIEDWRDCCIELENHVLDVETREERDDTWAYITKRLWKLTHPEEKK